MNRRTRVLLAIMQNGGAGGSYFGDAGERRAVARLVRAGLAEHVRTERTGDVTWHIARLTVAGAEAYCAASEVAS